MGLLLRGAQENFNPQIHTEATSLTYNMAKHFEVRKKSLNLFERYTKVQSFMLHSGRYNGGLTKGKVHKYAKEGLMDNAYRISYEGALNLPAYSYGAAQIGSWFDPGNSSPDMSGISGVSYTNGLSESTVTFDVQGSIAVKHDPDNNIFGDKFNPNDSIVLDHGLGIMFIIQQHGRRSADGTHIVYDGKFNGAAGLFDEDFLAEDTVLTEGGNYFGEGSLRGWQRYTRNKWYINYTSIHRSTVTMTGSAKFQKIAWIYNSETGSRMWEFQEILKNDEWFNKANELALRFSRTSMNASGHSWFENYGTNRLTLSGFKAESGLEAPMLGDGWIPQIADNFTIDYNPNNPIGYKLLESMIVALSQRSASGGSNTYVAVGDTIGFMAFDAGMKKLIGFGNPESNPAAGVMTGNIVNITNKKDVEIGFVCTKYTYLNHTIYYVNDDIFNDPGNFPTNGGVTGTGNIYVLNVTPLPDGVSNFEILAKGNRSFVRKYENGMHSFDNSMENSMVASSGFDGCSIHTLSELMAILYDSRSCAVIKANTAYTGGALAGNDFIAGPNQATKFMY